MSNAKRRDSSRWRTNGLVAGGVPRHDSGAGGGARVAVTRTVARPQEKRLWPEAPESGHQALS